MPFVDDVTRRSALKAIAGLAAAAATTTAATSVAAEASARPTFASTTPIRIGNVGLRVRDLDRMSAFYRDAIGLKLLEETDTSAILGVAGVPLLALEKRTDDRQDDPRTAGLFHTAFLMPTRKDLGAWLINVARRRVPLTGVADHLVSEAIYLDDPEGNGIEVYADRAPESWGWDGPRIRMATEPLDLDSLVAEAGPDPRPWPGAPAGFRIGHVHLRVGDVDSAERFYQGAIGFDVTAKVRGAAFLSSGHYHHHIGANAWRSQGAGGRPGDMSGLAWVGFEVADGDVARETAARLESAGVEMRRDGDVVEAVDPWGTALRFAAA